MVLRPDLGRFDSFKRFADRWGERLLGMPANESQRESLRIVGSAEQSFLREWQFTALGANVVSYHPQRRGNNWTQRSFETKVCMDVAERAWLLGQPLPAEPAAQSAGRAQVEVFRGRYGGGKTGGRGWTGGKAAGNGWPRSHARSSTSMQTLVSKER